MLRLLPKGGATAAAALRASTAGQVHARARLLTAATGSSPSIGTARGSAALAKATALRAFSTTQGTGPGAEMGGSLVLSPLVLTRWW